MLRFLKPLIDWPLSILVLIWLAIKWRPSP